MKSSIALLVCVVQFLVLLSCHGTVGIVISEDDCTESGSHRYHASHSAAYTSGYSQQHPSPSGHHATSSSYVRTGNTVPSGGYAADSEGDLQVASSVYSPAVTQVASNHQSSGTGGYGLYGTKTEESRSSVSRTSGYGSNTNTGYGATQSGYGATQSGYGATQSGYGATQSGYGASKSGYGASSDSHVREKYERLKGQADAFVHGNAPPPVGALAAVPLASHVGSASSSQYQHNSQRYSGATGNVLGVTYGTTGIEEDDSQKLVPVPATLPAAGALVGSRKEVHDSAISYSTSGVAPHTDGVDFSISQNTPLGVATHSSSQHLATNFEELKQKAEAFVHEGGPPPSSSTHVSADGLTQQSTRVETLPPKATSHNTYVVPVRVTVTREHTVLPGGGEGYHDQTGDVTSSSSQKTFSSQSGNFDSRVTDQSGNVGTTSYQSGNTVGYPQPGLGSASSYSYNAAHVVAPPKVYTVGPHGTVRFPSEQQLVETSTASAYGSSSAYTQQSSVRAHNVIVPGAVVINNEEESRKRSDKLFDLVSGYGTFLPAKEGETAVKETGGVGAGYVSGQTSGSTGYQSGVSGSTGYQSGVSGSTGYQSGVSGSSGYQSGVSGSSGYQSGVSGNTGGYQSGVAETSEEYHARISGSGGYQPVSGYQGVLPVGGTVRKTTSYSYSSSNQGVPAIGPGVPIGDPLSPPEVSGSYFSGGGAGSRHYTSQSGYGNSGGYGGNQGVSGYRTSGGYGTRNENQEASGYGTSGGYGTRNQGASGYASRYDSAYGSRDAASGYGVKGVGSGFSSRDATLAALPLCETALCDVTNVIPGSTGGVKKFGISSSWSSKSQTVNGKTHESKEAVVTVNDNGKVDTYATHS